MSKKHRKKDIIQFRKYGGNPTNNRSYGEMAEKKDYSTIWQYGGIKIRDTHNLKYQ